MTHSDHSNGNGRDVERWVILVLIALVVVVGTLSTFSIVRSYAVEGAANDAKTAADSAGSVSIETKQAAVDAKNALEEAIARSSNGQADPTAVIEALKAIHRIEIAVCHGPCPP